MTAPLREKTPPAVHAAPVDPITRARVFNTLLVSGLIGVFLSFVGAFGTDGVPVLFRTGFMVLPLLLGLGLVGSLFAGVAQVRLARRR